MQPFKPTHRIILSGPGDTGLGERREELVMLVDGAAYTRDEWDACANADWELTENGWRFQGRSTPNPSLEVTVELL